MKTVRNLKWRVGQNQYQSDIANIPHSTNGDKMRPFCTLPHRYGRKIYAKSRPCAWDKQGFETANRRFRILRSLASVSFPLNSFRSDKSSLNPLPTLPPRPPKPPNRLQCFDARLEFSHARTKSCELCSPLQLHHEPLPLIQFGKYLWHSAVTGLNARPVFQCAMYAPYGQLWSTADAEMKVHLSRGKLELYQKMPLLLHFLI